MKKVKILATLLCLVWAFSACNKDYPAPEFQVPHYDGPVANKTIADIKAMHINASGVDSICAFDDIFVVKAVVVSSDEGGNYYKSVVVQDETGGIEIQLDQNGLYNDFPVGQVVYIDCRGLMVGAYHNLPQIGWEYQGAVGRINQLFINKYIHKDGLPSADNLPAPVIIRGPSDLVQENVCKLAIIESGTFDPAAVGLPLAGNDLTTNRAFNVGGATLQVRTSNYAKFRTMIIPETNVSLTGILTVYASGSTSTYQFMLRTKADMQAALPPHEVEVLHSFTFNANSFTTGGWISEPAGQWTSQSYSGVNFAYHGSITDATLCDDWMISPAIQIADRAGVSLIINSRMTGGPGLQDYYRVYYSTTYSTGTFNESDWTLLPGNITAATDYIDAAHLDASAISGANFRIAIRYYKYSAAASAGWQIKEIRFEK
ncbi:MAG: DUF5689 domain-containing protein [Bacteroidales bacterium]|jgi:hypothetical protein|nr:DUF5689 domain-containing protein [Bacteroidales bacterium]